MSSDRPRVLIVDNHGDNTHRLEERLKARFETLSTPVMAEAAHTAETYLPDLILIGAETAPADACTLCRNLKSRSGTQEIPVVLFATQSEPDRESQAMASGAADFLVAPVGSPFLLDRLGNLIVQHQAHSRLKLGEAIYRKVREGIMVTDRDDRIVDVNPAFCQLTGYSRDEVIGKTPAFLKSGRHDEDFYRKLWAELVKTGSWSGEIWNRMKNGELHPQLLTIFHVKDACGEPTHYVGIWSDVRIIKDHKRKIERLAYYDPLTDLPNRSLLEDRIHQAIAYTLRAGGLLGIGFLDIDGYRSLTERLGHQSGDLILLEAAKRMTDLLRAGDTVARVGGDEFVFLLIGLENAAECEAITDRIIKLLAEPIVLPDGPVSITASVGLTFAPTDCINPDTLIRHADEAMVSVKTAGKNGFRVYQPSDESVGC